MLACYLLTSSEPVWYREGWKAAATRGRLCMEVPVSVHRPAHTGRASPQDCVTVWNLYLPLWEFLVSSPITSNLTY